MEFGPCRGRAPLPGQQWRTLGPVSTCLPFGLAEHGQSDPGSSGLQDLGSSASPGPSAAPQSPSQGALSRGSLWNQLMCQVSFGAPLLLPGILKPGGSPGQGERIDSSLRLPDFREEHLTAQYPGWWLSLLPINELAGVALQRGSQRMKV